MLWDERAVRDNLRNRDGKRVFYQKEGDTLTPSARDFLKRERVEILPASQAKTERYALLGGGWCEEKPEHFTHLNAQILVRKDHPRIRFRGAMDLLEAQLLLCGPETEEILELARRLIRCDVLEEPVGEFTLYGLTQVQQRSHSHVPQEHYGISHFMPRFSDGPAILQLNLCRCCARNAELAAVEAFVDDDGRATRPDILQAMNRMSSMLYILMLRHKAAESNGKG